MHISLAADPIFHIGSFVVTNTLLTSWLAMAVLTLFALLLSRRVRAVPRGIQNVTEVVFDSFLNLMDTVTGDRQQSKKFFPIIATIFLFIVTANWMGLLPGFGTIGFVEHAEGGEVFVPLFRTTNSDLNVTLALAIISVVATQVIGILAVGGAKYAKRFFNFKNPIFTFMGLLELISEFAKFISFSFRLFGNIFAGEVLLVIIATLIPFVVPLPFYFLELFVGVIQAFVFAILSLVFFKVATLEAH